MLRRLSLFYYSSHLRHCMLTPKLVGLPRLWSGCLLLKPFGCSQVRNFASFTFPFSSATEGRLLPRMMPQSNGSLSDSMDDHACQAV